MKRTAKSRKPYSYLQENFVLYYGVTDKRTPLTAKLISLLALIYLLSPIDLIPDVIPIAGWLDDLFIVPMLLHLAFRLLPAEVKESGWLKAKQHIVKLRIILAALIILAVGMMVGIFFLMKGALQHL